jgi:hypothetical protein
MRAWRFVPGIMGAVCLVGCGGDDRGHLELSGKTPAEASTLVSNVACEYVARCGNPTITCVGDSSGGGTDCTAVIVHEDYAACFADLQPDLEQTFACPDFTPALIDRFERCVDASFSRPCFTLAQLEALAAQAEAGAPVDIDPPECKFLDDPNTAPGC